MSNEVMNIWKSEPSEILLLKFFVSIQKIQFFSAFSLFLLLFSIFFIEYSLSKKEQSSSILGEFI